MLSNSFHSLLLHIPLISQNKRQIFLQTVQLIRKQVVVQFSSPPARRQQTQHLQIHKLLQARYAKIRLKNIPPVKKNQKDDPQQKC